jgi:sulfur-oxidizing protein SoxA
MLISLFFRCRLLNKQKQAGFLAMVLMLFLSLASGLAQSLENPQDGLAIGRQLLAEDNPGDLWTERGERLFHSNRGPKNKSLETCDLGLGPGITKGAFAQLPRYFNDTKSVQDLESRLLTCMVEIQGFARAELISRRFGTLDQDSDIEALVAFIGSDSNNLPMNIGLSHPLERVMYETGKILFYRRSGPLDFACMTCHGETGKRVRLQDLPNMTKKEEIQQAVTTGWPAYRGTHSTVRTMQHRLSDCNWQMRLPDLNYASDLSVAITTFLNYSANGGLIKLPGVRR